MEVPLLRCLPISVLPNLRTPLLALVAVGFLTSAGCGSDETQTETDTSAGPDISDVTDAGSVDTGSALCRPDIEGDCTCDYQGSSQGVCANQRLGPNGNCYEPEAFESTESTCGDGLDNDCDGDVDCADSDCAGAACGLGEGTAECVGGECKETLCSDGKDNDGDSKTDCGDEECTQNVCAAGTERKCPSPDDWEPDEQQTCDGIDNDCDGATDEGCGCTFDPSDDSNVDGDDTHGNGVCTDQTRDDQGRCQRPEAFEMRTGSESSCDGTDNDCDGATDEGCPCTFDPEEENNVDTDGSRDAGVCTGQNRNADGTCERPGLFESGTDAESNCNGDDNDCDGVVDEGCSCTYDPDDPDNVDSDGSNASGVCLGQIRNASGVCQKPPTFGASEVEACSPGKDDDCDGDTDEKSPLPAGVPCSEDCECKTGVCRGGTCGHLIFVSSDSKSGDIGGPSNADKTCDFLARNAGLPTDANWYALVTGNSGNGPRGRVTIAGAVERVDGTKVADGAGDLWDGNIDTPVNIDETGATVGTENVWTGASPGGTPAGGSTLTCDYWVDSSMSFSGQFGQTSATGGDWLSSGSAVCSNDYRLYCINGP